MDVMLLDKKDAVLRFRVNGMTIPIANALRRIMISEVPVMAIDEVVIIENSSVMQDEVLAHRLGLVPLKTDLDSYVLPEGCTCKSELGCNKCSTSLTLEAEAVDSTMTVYSGDLKSSNPSIVPVSDRIPLVRLAAGQKVKLEAYARLGKSLGHAKWQAVSVSAFKLMPQIDIGRKCDACGACVEICPRRVLAIAKGKLSVVSLEACTLCKDCETVCPVKPSAIKIRNAKDTVIFVTESTGALPPERIVIEAANILRGKSKDFAEQISKIKMK